MPELVIHGFDQIQRDLVKAGVTTQKALTAGLREAAEPTAQIAKQLSLGRIGEHHGFKMQKSPQWAEVRIGVKRSAVYIVPKEKGTKGHWDDPKRRPNLVALMLGKSFEPALDTGAKIVQARVAALLGRLLR